MTCDNFPFSFIHSFIRSFLHLQKLSRTENPAQYLLAPFDFLSIRNQYSDFSILAISPLSVYVSFPEFYYLKTHTHKQYFFQSSV